MSAVAAEPAGVPRARMMLQRAHWAATAFAGYDRERTRRIVEAVAEAAYQNAERYAEWAVEETGMGVVEHKRRKNEACSRGLRRVVRRRRLRRAPASTPRPRSSSCPGRPAWCSR